MASQDDLRSSDINNILKRYDEEGILISPGQKVLQNMEFGDTTLYPDYETAMQLIQSVEDDFYNLPAEDRMQFGNDPRTFIRAVGSDPEIVKRLGIKDTPSAQDNPVADQPQDTKETENDSK